MPDNYARVSATGPLRNTLYNRTGARPVLPMQQQGAPGSGGRGPEQFGDRSELSRKALERLTQESPEKSPPVSASRVPSWEELLNESNDRIRYAAIQVNRLHTTAVTTPSVLGQTLKDAVSTLKAVGLSITKICQEYSHDVASGRVMVQMPSPGGSATRQMGVAVVVSKGPIPDDDFDFMGHVRPAPGTVNRGLGQG